MFAIEFGNPLLYAIVVGNYMAAPNVYGQHRHLPVPGSVTCKNHTGNGNIVGIIIDKTYVVNLGTNQGKSGTRTTKGASVKWSGRNKSNMAARSVGLTREMWTELTVELHHNHTKHSGPGSRKFMLIWTGFHPV